MNTTRIQVNRLKVFWEGPLPLVTMMMRKMDVEEASESTIVDYVANITWADMRNWSSEFPIKFRGYEARMRIP